MELRSTAIREGEPLDRRHAWPDCGGANVSPDLAWSGAPPAVASFAVACYDPDAPRGWWHWVAYDIPADVDAVPEGGPLPEGAVETRNSFRAPGWGGPCPPPGPPHRYLFTVYALPDAHLPVRHGADPAEAIRAAERRRIDQAALTATFRRS